MHNFSENLKSLRKEYKLTQEDIAPRIGISRAAYARYETGSSEPTIHNLIILADLFKVSIDFLVGREANNKSDIESIIMQKNIEKNMNEVGLKVIEKFLESHKEEIKLTIANELRGNTHE